jgi:hypothetical protein
VARAAQSDEEKGAALKAALEQAQGNPAVRALLAAVGSKMLLLGLLDTCTDTSLLWETATARRRRAAAAQPQWADRRRPHTCAELPRPAALLPPSPPPQMAAQMKQMEAAMANPAMQSQMSSMM